MKKLKNFISAFFIALFALVLSYVASNWSFMGWEEKSLLGRTDLFKGLVNEHSNKDIEDVIFVDVTYDKELRTIYFDDGLEDSDDLERMILGKTQVSDRDKILRFLQILKEKDDYKYILLDIAFPAEIESERDSDLFELIAGMRDIVVPRHSDMRLVSPALISKSGVADYSTIYNESDFIRYPYMIAGEKSLPLVIYENTQGRNIRTYEWWSTDNGTLARKSIPLPLDIRMKGNQEEIEGSVFTSEDLEIYLLGKDILGDSTEPEEENFSILEEDPELFKGKYVVVGSLYGDDNHSTYAGDLPGSLILYNAYLSLLKGRHLLSVPLLAVLFVIFFLISYTILVKQELRILLRRNMRRSKKKGSHTAYRLMIFMVENFAIEASLAIICVLIYILSGEIFDIIVTGFYFVVISWFVNNARKLRIIFFKKQK